MSSIEPSELQIANPMMLSVAQRDHHKSFLDHEADVALRFPAALAAEPGLTCFEWEHRNPFLGNAT